MTDSELLQTPLAPIHRAAGARMVPFGAWSMPVEYPTGSLAEHAAVRSAVGIFDVSHMGRLLVHGPGALGELNRILAGDLERIGDGRAQYTILCNDTGGVIDDLIAYRLGQDRVLLVPNAGNAATVKALLREQLGSGVAVTDLGESEGLIAVQGPASPDLMVRLGLLADPDALAYMAVAPASYAGESVLVARSGYTGERGYEVLAPAHLLAQLWEELAEQAQPCGLGARDILRLEMGYPLHGADLGPDTSALECGLSWVIAWDKPHFSGRPALLAQRAAGRALMLRGLRLTGRGVPRAGMAVVSPEGGATYGQLTSGTFSPTLRTGIALGRITAGLPLGSQVGVEIRGRVVPAEVVHTPFVSASPK